MSQVINKPDFTEQFNKLRAEIIKNTDVARIITENEMTDEQIDRSIADFNDYIVSKKEYESGRKQDYYPKLIWCEEYDCPLVVFNKSTQLEHRETEYQTSDVLERDSLIIDKSIKKASFENFVPSGTAELKALQFAKIEAEAYRVQKNGNLVFTGKAGTGKSHLAMSIARYVNDVSKTDGRYQKVLFISCVELFRKMKNDFNQPDSKFNEGRMMRLLTGADLLVLDDLGAETGKGTANSWIEQFLSSLFEARENTIITTNFTGEELKRMYGQRFVSRLLKGIDGHSYEFSTMTDKRRSS